MCIRDRYCMNWQNFIHILCLPILYRYNKRRFMSKHKNSHCLKPKRISEEMVPITPLKSLLKAWVLTPLVRWLWLYPSNLTGLLGTRSQHHKIGQIPATVSPDSETFKQNINNGPSITPYPQLIGSLLVVLVHWQSTGSFIYKVLAFIK